MSTLPNVLICLSYCDSCRDTIHFFRKIYEKIGQKGENFHTKGRKSENLLGPLLGKLAYAFIFGPTKTLCGSSECLAGCTAYTWGGVRCGRLWFSFADFSGFFCWIFSDFYLRLRSESLKTFPLDEIFSQIWHLLLDLITVTLK